MIGSKLLRNRRKQISAASYSGNCSVRVELARNHRLVSLLADELAYKAVRFINNRAQKRHGRAPPLCAPTADLICHRLISTGIFERTQVEAVDALLRNRKLINRPIDSLDVFIDVGANIGLYATRYSMFFKKTLAIEANPMAYDVLRSNIALSRSPNVVPICIGASDKSGRLPLHISEDGMMGWSSFENGGSAQSFSLEVPLKTIDKIVEEYAPGENVSIIKIDVEGHELRVLQGSTETLERYKPILLYEQLNRAAGTDCKKLLKAAGYTNFVRFTRSISLLRLFSKSPVYAESVNPIDIEHAALICAY